MEKENFLAGYIYWIEKGEILIHKKVDHLYVTNPAYNPDEKKLLCMKYVKPLDLFHNPKDSPFAKIGVCLGTFTEKDTILAEDSGLFKENMNYTLVAGKGLLVYRYDVNNALKGWPVDTIKEMRKNVLTKYEWIY